MAQLFLDTTNFLVLGLLDENDQWIEYQVIRQQKNSQIIHLQLYQLLQRHGYTLPQIQQLFIMAGPGSYTGVRLAALVAQIMKLEGTAQVFSFYHFQVPQLLGHSTGIWACPAFKGEYFIFDYPTNKGQTYPAAVALELIAGHGTHGVSYWADTDRLIHDHPQAIFGQVRAQALALEPFYFRPEEKEFSLPRQGGRK